MRTFLPKALVVSLAVLAGSAALAEDPCAEDVKQFCPDVPVGSGKMMDCLRQNEKKLSPACGERMQADALKSRRIVEEFGRACKPDVEQFCAAVEPGAGRTIGCLARHQLEISPACQTMLGRLDEARERISAFRAACKVDVESICKDVPPLAGPLLECLQENQARLSSECSRSNLNLALEGANLVDTVEQMTRQDRVREVLQILQGVDSVAFSRSQVLLQLDSFESLGAKGNAGRLLFNPQFVFGERGEFALQIKVPVSALYPYAAGTPTQFGLGAVTTAFGWRFFSQGQIRQFVGLALQWQTASTAAVGAPWALTPYYAVALGLARWVSLTAQVVYSRSLGETPGYPELNFLLLEPILVFNLPGRSYLALDTKLGWSFVTGTFVPVMKAVAGIYTDRQKSLSISAWYQAALTSEAAAQTFKYGLGLGLAYYFDW
jgi:hypothetical protein